MKKLFAILLLATALSLPANAQQANEKPIQNVYLELFGASNTVGINYDARFKSHAPWGYRVGLGYSFSKSYSMFSGSHSFRGPDIPLEINYLKGKKRSKFELGLGLNLGYYTEKYDTWSVRQVGAEDDIPIYETVYDGEAKHSQWGYYFFGNIGYLYQPARGFQFRAGLNPSFNLGGKHAVSRGMFPYVSFGYAF